MAFQTAWPQLFPIFIVFFANCAHMMDKEYGSCPPQYRIPTWKTRNTKHIPFLKDPQLNDKEYPSHH